MVTRVFPSSHAMNLLNQSKQCFDNGNIEAGKNLFRQASVELQDAISCVARELCQIKGIREDEVLGEAAFFDNNLQNSTAHQKALAIYRYIQRILPVEEILISRESECPCGLNDRCSDWTNQTGFWLGGELVHILAPNGRYVHALAYLIQTGESDYGSNCYCLGSSSAISYRNHRLESASDHKQHRHSTTHSILPLKNYDYVQKGGYQRTGDFYADPNDPLDIQNAQNRHAAREQDECQIL